MTDVTSLTVTATAEAAIKKLKKAEISVFNCRKKGAEFTFSVKDKHLKKVFAIFSKPCYNIRVTGESRRTHFIKRILTRAGLAAGAFAFVIAAAVSNAFVFKISVSGSGAYLASEVKRIIYESGAKEFTLLTHFDAPAATGKILALPQVTFCNIEKKGSILKVDVQVDEELGEKASLTSLVADKSGTVKNIVAICGTPNFSVGDKVNKGDTLISNYSIIGEEKAECLAVGYAELECGGRCEYFAEADTEENLKAAYSSALLYADEILTRTHTVKQAEGGIIYVIDFTYLHKLSINLK
ncbi:MAG: sporulation protein YqfD [Clostridia bacterium]|nr:sporulation protein YqfD [Clostridia bacterium]